MPQHHLPPGIDGQVSQAISAMVSCEGMTQEHIETIRYCMHACPESFFQAYEGYFDSLGLAAAPSGPRRALAPDPRRLWSEGVNPPGAQGLPMEEAQAAA
jgi:hypothetical protein